MAKNQTSGFRTSRRGFLKAMGGVAGAMAAPALWIPRRAYAQTEARGEVAHLLYIRLSGGFRFTAAFNSDVAAEFNPFGVGDAVPSSVEWRPSSLFNSASFLSGGDGEARSELGMQRLIDFSNQVALVPCVDHEPAAQRADGNHASGTERFLTGAPDGDTGFLTMLNYGVRDRLAEGLPDGTPTLPAISFGSSGMARGFDDLAAHRPPVLQGNGLEKFGFDAEAAVPSWAAAMTSGMDARLRDRVHPQKRTEVDEYMQTREATQQFSQVFNSDILKISEGSDEPIDGISNRELNLLFGDSQTGRNGALALRLFRFGCPAVYMSEGSYDLHSEEENRLPPKVEDLHRLISALQAAMRRMTHPSGGSLWDHTLVVLGSEFGRTTRGNRFNSARGSDHGGDLATRWLSMPMMGGLIERSGVGGRSFGRTRARDLTASGRVYSYRAMLKTMMDLVGADHARFFEADPPITDFFG